MKNNLISARPVALALGLAALLGAIPAHAADVISEEPPAPAAPMEEPPLNTWSGPYAGVTLGYGFSGTTEDETNGNSIDTSGFLAGGFAGFNYQTGNIVAGAEADLGYNWEDGTNAGLTSESGFEGSLRARLGYVIAPDVMLYATAGGAGKKLEVSDFAGSDENTMLGWTAGAGAEMMLSEQVFGRVEYRYTDFGSDTFNTGSGARQVNDSDHRINFGLGMKF
jgi:outer membrane immunogenic protein